MRPTVRVTSAMITEMSSVDAITARVIRPRRPVGDRRRMTFVSWPSLMAALDIGAFMRSGSGLEAISEAANRQHVTGIGRIGLDLCAQASNVYIDKPSVAELVLSPDFFEQVLP